MKEKKKKDLNNIKNENGLIDNRKRNRLTDAKTRGIDDEVVRKHFLLQDLSDLLEKLQSQIIILKKIKFR